MALKSNIYYEINCYTVCIYFYSKQILKVQWKPLVVGENVSNSDLLAWQLCRPTQNNAEVTNMLLFEDGTVWLLSFVVLRLTGPVEKTQALFVW